MKNSLMKMYRAHRTLSSFCWQQTLTRSLTFLLGACLTALPVAASANQSGEFVKGNGGVKVQAQGEMLAFELYAFKGLEMCEIKGEAVFIDKTSAGYKRKGATACELVFKFSNDSGGAAGLTLSSKGCVDVCGKTPQDMIDGIYKRKK